MPRRFLSSSIAPEVNIFELLSLISSQGAPRSGTRKASMVAMAGGPRMTSGAADRANGNEVALHLPSHATCSKSEKYMHP